MTKNRFAVAFDGFHDIWRRAQAFIRDRRIKCREVDRPYWLSAEYERIVSQAFPINLCFGREFTKALETGFGLLLDTAIEQTNGREIAGVLYRLPQGQRAARATVIVLRRPVVLLAGTSTADRRQGDRLIQHERIGLQTLAQCRQVAERLDGGARLAHGLSRAIELAQGV